jgi:predicted Holliday junction resolvase-like endonuclease
MLKSPINFITVIDLFYLKVLRYLQKLVLNIQVLLYHFAMRYTELTLPQDQIQLQAIVLDQQCKLEEQEIKLTEQQKLIEHIREQYDNLQHQIKCLLRNQYGRKSEQGIPGQGNLFEALDTEDEHESEQPEEETLTYTRKKSRQRSIA